MICFHCDRCGHKANQCNDNIDKVVLAGNENMQVKGNLLAHKTVLVGNAQDPSSSSLVTEPKDVLSNFGPWMVATRKQRKQGPNKKSVESKEGDRKNNGEGPKVNPGIQLKGYRFIALNSKLSPFKIDIRKYMAVEEIQVDSALNLVTNSEFAVMAIISDSPVGHLIKHKPSFASSSNSSIHRTNNSKGGKNP